MDVADMKRAAMKEKIEVDEETIKQKELQKTLQKNPQKKPLDESDVRIIKNYIEDAREAHEKTVRSLEMQKKYH